MSTIQGSTLPTSTTEEATASEGPSPVVSRQRMFSLSVATGVTALLCLSPAREHLPGFWVAAGFLFLAVESDVRSFRLPNLLTLPALALALAFALATGGLPALGTALFGALLAFALTFPPFAFGAIGAGDAKALMALGALCGAGEFQGMLHGAGEFLGMLWWMVICGGALGISVVVLQGGTLDLAKRWSRTAKTMAFTRYWNYERPGPGSAAQSGLPFAVAIGLGISAYYTWGLPWPT